MAREVNPASHWGTPGNVPDWELQAREEVRFEAWRAEVEVAKERIRERRARPWWKRLFPYTIRVERT